MHPRKVFNFSHVLGVGVPNLAFIIYFSLMKWSRSATREGQWKLRAHFLLSGRSGWTPPWLPHRPCWCPWWRTPTQTSASGWGWKCCQYCQAGKRWSQLPKRKYYQRPYHTKRRNLSPYWSLFYLYLYMGIWDGIIKKVWVEKGSTKGKS